MVLDLGGQQRRRVDLRRAGKVSDQRHRQFLLDSALCQQSNTRNHATFADKQKISHHRTHLPAMSQRPQDIECPSLSLSSQPGGTSPLHVYQQCAQSLRRSHRMDKKGTSQQGITCQRMTTAHHTILTRLCRAGQGRNMHFDEMHTGTNFVITRNGRSVQAHKLIFRSQASRRGG